MRQEFKILLGLAKQQKKSAEDTNTKTSWKFCESAAVLAAEELRRSHLTSNWFHQTWKLHCYLIWCLSGSNDQEDNLKIASSFFVEDFL